MDWNYISKQIDKVEKKNPTMNIQSKPGTKIIFKYPDNGHEYDSEISIKELLYNAVYTVKEVHDGGWISYVELEEKPGNLFNTLHFANLKEET